MFFQLFSSVKQSYKPSNKMSKDGQVPWLSCVPKGRLVLCFSMALFPQCFGALRLLGFCLIFRMFQLNWKWKFNGEQLRPAAWANHVFAVTVNYGEAKKKVTLCTNRLVTVADSDSSFEDLIDQTLAHVWRNCHPPKKNIKKNKNPYLPHGFFYGM